MDDEGLDIEAMVRAAEEAERQAAEPNTHAPLLSTASEHGRAAAAELLLANPDLMVVGGDSAGRSTLKTTSVAARSFYTRTKGIDAVEAARFNVKVRKSMGEQEERERRQRLRRCAQSGGGAAPASRRVGGGAGGGGRAGGIGGGGGGGGVLSRTTTEAAAAEDAPRVSFFVRQAPAIDDLAARQPSLWATAPGKERSEERGYAKRGREEGHCEERHGKEHCTEECSTEEHSTAEGGHEKHEKRGGQLEHRGRQRQGGRSEGEGEDLRLFAKEYSSNGSRSFLVASAESFWNYYTNIHPDNRHFYEIIRERVPCRLYFDLE